MLDALNQVLPAVGTKKLSQYFVIRNRTVTGFNGEQVLTVPILCDIEFAPKAKAFFRVVKKCKGSVALWINNEGNVMVHGENFDATIECAPMEKFPTEIQTGFWFNEPKAKKPSKPKNVPPEPVWLNADYLPGLEEAKLFNVPLFNSDDLVAAVIAKEPFILDCEVFKNYFLCALTSAVSGKVVYFENYTCVDPISPDDENFNWVANWVANSIDTNQSFERLEWILKHALIVTFNGTLFDIPILALALAGQTCAQLKSAGDKIIQQVCKPWQVLKSAKVKKLNINHIDLIEVAPGVMTSLKIYAGRMHAPRMQDLPFPHDSVLSDDQISIVRYYCVNDLTATAFCFVNLREQLELRQSMSERYGMDLRSKSDAQIAEAVINGELQRLTFAQPERPTIATGTRYYYNKPSFVSFKTPLLQRTLDSILKWEFWLEENGYIQLPVDPETNKSISLKVQIGNGIYTIGIGGLHSNETTVCHKADSDHVILDRDVTSYYPSIILNLELYPKHLGTAFLQVYRLIVQRRIEAKKNKNKAEAETLKIVVNGSFGKLGSKWSTLYAPDLLMTVTITGQLCLLMLVEALELAGITVCSANTDGIISKCPKSKRNEFNRIFADWEKLTGFATEETEYTALYSRDVNNYIAVKPDGKTKAKGVYFNPWAYPEYAYDRFKKNPDCTIVLEAVTAYLTKGKPIFETIREETDVRKFIAIKTVSGGGSKDGVYLGKAVRWYYGKSETGCIVAVKSGNKVATTDGAVPCMDLPPTIPLDLDYTWYEVEAQKILSEIGYTI